MNTTGKPSDDQASGTAQSDSIRRQPAENSDDATVASLKLGNHRHWSNQFDAIARELSRLAIALNIDLFEPGAAEKILKNDRSVCRIDNPEAFRKMRQHLMALFPLEEAAIERLGADDTHEILQQVRDAIARLRAAGRPGS